MKKKSLFFLVLLVSFSFSCQHRSADEIEIRNVLSERKIALETGDLKKYESIIANNYFDKKRNETKERLLNKFRGIVANTESRKINFSDTTIYFDKKNDNKATVVEKVFLEVVMKGGKNRYLKSKEKIELEKVGKKWKISGGL